MFMNPVALSVVTTRAPEWETCPEEIIECRDSSCIGKTLFSSLGDVVAFALYRQKVDYNCAQLVDNGFTEEAFAEFEDVRRTRAHMCFTFAYASIV